MKVLILAGGLGTRLSEETELIPKPMVKIGDLPILIHIMNHYAKYNIKNFVIAAGYKSEVIDQYFQDSRNIPSGFTIKVVDTGLETATAGRISKCLAFLGKTFMMTYGDGLSDVDIELLIKHHMEKKRYVTVTAVRPPARFGTIQINDGLVSKFSEKDPQEVGWINGGFFVLENKIEKYLNDPQSSFESRPITDLVNENQLAAFKHEGWWHPMDTLRDKKSLEQIWQSGSAPWAKSE